MSPTYKRFVDDNCFPNLGDVQSMLNKIPLREFWPLPQNESDAQAISVSCCQPIEKKFWTKEHLLRRAHDARVCFSG